MYYCVIFKREIATVSNAMPCHHPEEIWKERLSTVGASLQSCLIVTVIAICETKSYAGSQFLFFHLLGNHFVTVRDHRGAFATVQQGWMVECDSFFEWLRF